MFEGSRGEIGYACIPTWNLVVIVITTITVVVVGIVVVSIHCANKQLERRRAQTRYRRYHKTEEYQHEVRRQWLRGIHALTGGKDGVYDFPRTTRNARDVRQDPNVSQLIEFFHTYKGLLRPMGTIMTLYYSPSSAPAFLSRGHSRGTQ